jgi:hypothetical protein
LKKILLALSAIAVFLGGFCARWLGARTRSPLSRRASHRRFHEERPRVVERERAVVERPRHIAYAAPAPVYAQPGITITLPW